MELYVCSIGDAYCIVEIDVAEIVAVPSINITAITKAVSFFIKKPP